VTTGGDDGIIKVSIGNAEARALDANPRRAIMPAQAEIFEAQLLAEELESDFQLGEAWEVLPMGVPSVSVAGELWGHLWNHVRRARAGHVVSDMLFRLRDGDRIKRRPDVAFVSKQRWPQKALPTSAWWPVAPDLAIEVISPTDLAGYLADKVRHYFDAGVNLVWAVYPEGREIMVYANAKSATILREGDALEGDPVLPGFQLDVTELFRAGLEMPS